MRLIHRRRRHERGAASVEFIIVVTVLVVFLFATMVQWGIRSHANRVAEAAAREGVVDAAAIDGDAAAGKTTAKGFVESTGHPAVTGSTVAADRTATEASVTVTVTVLTLVPWGNSPISSTATAPVERFAE